MMKIRKKRMLCIVAILLLVTTVYGQVTIGSSEPPITGALLDLKEEGTTKRGVLLPRVSLINLTTLEPIFTYEDEVSTPTNEELKSHKGLLVYNVGKQQKGACDFTPNYLELGIYVWNGEKWLALGKRDDINPAEDIIEIVVRNPDVKIFTDRRRGKVEKYTCRQFGDAIWMTMNLRATEYSENSNVSITLSKGDFSAGTAPSSGAYYFTPYPVINIENKNKQYIGYDASWMERQKLVGYIYSYDAITAKASVPVQSSTLVQGLCPDGWHVPRLEEYQALKLHIQNNQEKYLDPAVPSTSTIKYSDALIVPCSPYKPEEITTQANSRLLTGRSLSYSDGGFGDFGLGIIPIANDRYAYGRHTHQWVYYVGRNTGKYDHNIPRISTGLYSSEGEDIKLSANVIFGTGLRCVKAERRYKRK